MKSMTTGDIVKLIRDNSGLTIDKSSGVVNLVLSSIREALITGRKIKLEGLGAFEVKWRGGRKIQNIKTKAMMETKPYKSVHFSPCSKIKNGLNH
jgi:nucleoid DNA-binding protein